MPTQTPSVPAPSISAITPNSGYNDRNTNVTLTGNNFQRTPSLSLGGHPLINIAFVDATRLLAIVPANLPPGTYDLAIANPDGQSVRLPAAFTILALQPVLLELAPNQGRADLPNDVYIYGFNFAAGAVASLGDTPLNTFVINATRLRASIPAGLAPGAYPLTVTNPDAASASLSDAYTVIDPTSDDLFGYGYELWTDPSTLRAADQAWIGLIVRRPGGQNVLGNVAVRFYRGDPQAGGVLLGDGTIPLLSPHTSASTSRVNWTLPAAGQHAVYAVIDPDNAIVEADEANNVISRTVSVLPPATDQIAPSVDRFAINDGDETTGILTVTLDTTASDPPPSSGLASLLYIEYEYSPSAGQWVPVQSSTWLPYASARENYPWVMLPSAAMKYLQAWAADGVGNISLHPYGRHINYLPPTDRVAQGQSRIYRFALAAGQQLTARVIPASGDPDLYVWAPDYQTRLPWVSDLSGSATDQVSFAAPVSGTYQVEVYGYTAAEYRLTVTTTAGKGAKQPIQPGGGRTAAKPAPSQPIVALSNVPGGQVGLPVPPAAQRRVYLPVALRNDPSSPQRQVYLPVALRNDP
jgi:hypothetical protein